MPTRDLTLKPVKVETGSPDEDGLLVFDEGRLVAVLVRLDSDVHEDNRGKWFLEAGFNGLAWDGQVFDSLGDAGDWISAKLKGSGDGIQR
ncbi:hypothetical protein [Consotaella aegiceratis]|uniref:hypothetical protein n=1 Tax=Consotaella aegiceratis TaxID=3097961 RepID=UPI002F42E3D7